MKLFILSLTCLLLLSTGCAHVPSPYSDQLKPVIRRYASIEKGTPRPAIEEQLGKPTREEGGACLWESRFDDWNYATLRVWFDVDETAKKVAVTQAHGKSVPGYHASAVSTRTK